MKKFTLIEMMMVLGIIAILFGIGTAVFTVATGKSETARAKSEITILNSATEMYYDRWGQYPVPSAAVVDAVNDAINFGEWFSKISPINPLFQDDKEEDEDEDKPKLRPMMVNFTSFDISNPDYAHYNKKLNKNTIIYDPWGTPYGYSYDPTTKSFIIYSVGVSEGLSKLSASFDSATSKWRFYDNSTEISDPTSAGILSSHLK